MFVYIYTCEYTTVLSVVSKSFVVNYIFEIRKTPAVAIETCLTQRWVSPAGPGGASPGSFLVLADSLVVCVICFLMNTKEER